MKNSIKYIKNVKLCKYKIHILSNNHLEQTIISKGKIIFKFIFTLKTADFYEITERKPINRLCLVRELLSASAFWILFSN